MNGKGTGKGGFVGMEASHSHQALKFQHKLSVQAGTPSTARMSHEEFGWKACFENNIFFENQKETGLWSLVDVNDGTYCAETHLFSRTS